MRQQAKGATTSEPSLVGRPGSISLANDEESFNILSASVRSDGRENRRSLVGRANRATEDAKQFAPHADMGCGQVSFGVRPLSPNIVGDHDIESARGRIETNDVAVANLGDDDASMKRYEKKKLGQV